MTNKIFKKNESVIRIQAERSDPIRTNVVFFSHDKGTAKMLIRLEKDGAPQPLPSGTEVLIHLALMGAEAKTHIYYASIDDAAAGLVSIILKDDTLRHHGRVEGSIYIKPPNDQHLDSSGRFLFNIERSPIDDISEDASQFYYEGFTIVYDKIAEVRRIVSTMTTEAKVDVDQKIRDLEAQINRFLQDAQSKFTSLDRDIAAVSQTVTQLENRLTTVRNEIETLFNTMKIDIRNWVTGTTEPLNIVGNNATNQTINPYRFTFGQIKDIPAKAGDSVVIAYDWEASGSTISGTFFPQFNNQPYSMLNRETISPSATNQSGTSSFVTTAQAAWFAENAISNAIGFRADNLQGTVTITNFRFLIANKDSGWMPAVEEFDPKANINLAGSNDYTKLPFDIGKNIYGEESDVITGVIIPVKRGQLYTVTSYDRVRHDRFNIVFSTSTNRPTAGTSLTYIMGNNGNEPMTWRATSDGWMGVQLATGSSDGFPKDGRIMIERRRQSSEIWKPAFEDISLKQESISARNLVPNSSFYNDTHGWAVNGHLTATSAGAYTRFVKAAVTGTRATISREVIDDRIKPGTEYTLGVMVYVESATVLANSSASTIFLRTNNGAMLDAPLGTIDWSRVGEWQFVTGTGITRPGTWVNRPQITIAIGENTICTFRIKEFGIVEGSRYLGWFPDSAEIALRKDLEETQQKVQTLEENTIRLTNYFPDYNFQKQTPQPIAENGVTISYDGAAGVVFRNETSNQGRINWAAPLLGLMVGKTYNVSMYLNVGSESHGKEFEVGTSLGNNFTFTAPNTEPVWRHGTIGLTTWAAFSVWLPPNSAIRLRELYIYEANTDITTARIEQIENSIRTPANKTIFDGANWFLEGHSYNYNIDELAEGILLVWSRFTAGEGAHEFGFHETFINKHTIAMYDGRPRYANMPDSVNTINKSFVVTPSRVYGHADNGNHPRNAWALRKIILM
ncbi:phage pre-neck appendage-like protein [Enterococcus casseliflavus]|uniref:phage baseplate upper protein n=1 Tax=Enterococcus casseliflavus TaxID=37734 RepID=UPI000DFAE2FC|nr:phage baseplate upper protein [Enterococcus casseliflavus]GEB30167.1 hypothetical protein ECA02_32620 [Enterococcus casseliflavus]STP33078.1 phage pre-neck appendage-like protein [Enterococcus casseliflavus]